MSSPIIVSDPTRSLRDWLRTQTVLEDLDGRVWAGGLPSTAFDSQGRPTASGFPAIVVHRIGSAVNTPVDEVEWQFDVWALTSSASAHWASVLATLLLQTNRTTLGHDDDGNAHVWLGADDASVSILQSPADPDQPDLHRHTVTAKASTVTVPT